MFYVHITSYLGGCLLGIGGGGDVLVDVYGGADDDEDVGA